MRKSTDPIDVVAAIIRRADRVLLARRPDTSSHLAGYWEFPGGKREEGESHAEALVREIREELGVEITVDDELIAVEHAYPEKTVRITFLNATLVDGEPHAQEGQLIRWVTPAEMEGLLMPAADVPVVEKLGE
jgi:8-oxo-dGTP diphosphatase